MKAVKGTEVLLTTDNKVGKLEEISKTVRDSGINIRAISAWVFESKAFFRLIVSDNTRAKAILQEFGTIEEKSIVIADMPDEVGQLFFLASKLKDNNIDLNYIYGTTSELGKAAIIIFSSCDNDKALEVIAA